MYDRSMTSRDAVEKFHLLFLRALAASLEDRSLVTLKGGSNLRFYFGSPRYSEDMDLAVRTVARGTLARKVERSILESASFTRVLVAHGLAVERWSAPKQTDTVQRWKISIRHETLSEPTKVEFSRRSVAGGEVEPIPSSTLERQRVAGPIVASHYPIAIAAEQKIEALISRTEPQARDVFDLHWLLSRGARIGRLSAKRAKEATARTLAFTRDDFEGHVLAYLDDDERKNWTAREVIEAMQLRVAGAIEATA